MNPELTEFLTPKQLLFCTEYLTDMNATRAALRAGYSSSTALNGQLMNIPKIKCYLQQQTQQRMERVQFTHDQVLRELGKIAFGNMADYFAADGSIKPMNEVGNDAKAALWSVSVSDAGSGGSVIGDNTDSKRLLKFRMYNKLSALDKIAKHIGFYKPEMKPAETAFAFLNPEQLTADDTFDDVALQDELKKIRHAKLKVKKAEVARDKREAAKVERARQEVEKGDTTNLTDTFDLNAIPVDEDGTCCAMGREYLTDRCLKWLQHR